jgi:lysophospholipase L1-like esterase
MVKTIDIRNLEIELEDASDFKKTAGVYFEPKYIDDGSVSFQLKQKYNLAGPLAGLGSRPNSILAAGTGNGGIDDWFIDRERKNRRKKYLKKKDNLNVIRIVAEGDSWFQHPLIHDIIDHIEKKEDYAVLSLARAKDTLFQMVTPGEYLDAVISEKPKYFLLSAGGNDMLGDIKPFLALPTKQNPQPADYLSTDFDTLLMGMKKSLQQLITNVMSAHPNIERILIHGYDYIIPVQHNTTPPTGHSPVPTREGKWVGHKMREKGITHFNTQKLIVKEMIDQYAGILTQLANQNPKVQFVDFRGAHSNITDWYDEIHLYGSRYKKLAKKFINLMH